MLMALPNLDGSFTGTVYMEARGPTSSFQALQDRQACAKWCAEHYGAAAPLAGGLDRLVEQLCHNPVGLLGTVCTERWAVDGRAVLIGDAAHAMVPFFGQGCNCGFEDVLWLGKMLDKHCPEPAAATGEHFAACFQELEQLRKPNADAICAMALENFVEMRDKTADPVFCAKKQLESLLENAFPERFRSRYAMVCYGGEGEVSYRNAYELGPIQDRILSTLHAQLPDNKDPVLDEALARQLIEELLEPELRARGMDLSTVRH